jgi:signal transduction histidine kinase
MNDHALSGYRGGSLDDPAIAHLQELQRFAEIGRLSASLLHEMSNPLTAAMLHLEPTLTSSPSNIRHARQNMQVLQRYVEAARQQVKHASKPRLFSARSQLEQVRRILEPHARRHLVRLRFQMDASPRLFGDAIKFQQIVANLVKNAIDSYATVPDGNRQVVICLQVVENALTITVTDQGLGMSPNELEQIFEPFYTTKVKAGHGLGIGLTIVKQFVEHDFGGSIIANSTYGSGTSFIVSLPLRKQA